MLKIGTKLQGNTGLFNTKDYGAIISRVIAERSRASVLGSGRGPEFESRQGVANQVEVRSSTCDNKCHG